MTVIVRPDGRFSQEIGTGTGAMAPVTFTPLDRDGVQVSAKVREVRLHLSSVSSTIENFVVSLDSGQGSQYDVVKLTVPMNGVRDIVFDDEMQMIDGDKLLFTWPNSQSLTYGLEIIYEEYKS